MLKSSHWWRCFTQCLILQQANITLNVTGGAVTTQKAIVRASAENTSSISQSKTLAIQNMTSVIKFLAHKEIPELDSSKEKRQVFGTNMAITNNFFNLKNDRKLSIVINRERL